MWFSLVLTGLICAGIAGSIAHRKGLSVPRYALLGLVLTGVGVIIAILARPSAERGAEAEPTREEIELAEAKDRIRGG